MHEVHGQYDVRVYDEWRGPVHKVIYSYELITGEKLAGMRWAETVMRWEQHQREMSGYSGGVLWVGD